MDINKLCNEIYKINNVAEILQLVPPKKLLNELNLEFVKSSQRTKIDRYIAGMHNDFLESYKIIKGDSWPNCNSVDDFYYLPDWIKKECIDEHKFSPDIWIENIYKYCTVNEEIDEYTPSEIARIKFILLDNEKFIRNKKVVDFCCNNGLFTNICSLLSANSVVGTDIRNENIIRAAKLRDALSISTDKVEFTNADIRDYSKNTELCSAADTVILAGIMYHVHDHYSILESIVKARPKTIIVATADANSITDDPRPLIEWRIEPTLELTSGYYNGQDNILHGLPNTEWFKLATKALGYDYIKTIKFPIWLSHDMREESMEMQAVHILQRI